VTDPGDSRPGLGLRVLFLAVLVDLVGFGIVLPLLPLYADRFGASGVEVGLLVTVYSLVQFFMAPFWGRLSDRVGRRPVLIVGLLGSAISYVVFAYASTLLMLFVSRILAGLGGSTVPVAEAYIADVTEPEKRAGGIGLLGAAFGIGFIVGPAVGGILASVDPVAPGLTAAVLCGSNALLALALLPESLRLQPNAHSSGHQGWIPYLQHVARSPDILSILAVYLFFSMAWAVLQPTLSLFGAQRFGMGAREVGYLFAFLGLISAIVQGGLVRRLVPMFGEVRLIRLAGPPFVIGLLVLAFSTSLPVLLLGLALLAVGYGGAIPSVLGLLSRRSPAELQGGTLGMGQGVGAMARMAGPFAAGVAFDALGISWPYLLGAGFAAGAMVLAFSLTQPIWTTTSESAP
jgi:DHA1 family tetracycline resistance protein-like MFS transporter